MFQSLFHIILTYSYAGVFSLVFIESGLVIGAFLPGDSFLFLTGMLAGKDHLNIYILIPTIIFGAIAGNEFGYWVGKKYGWVAITKLSKKYSTPEYHAKAHAFYERWGVYAIVIVRFVPVLRSLLPTIAGMAEMRHKTFTLANILGALLWGGTVTLTGYVVGDHVSNHMMFMVPAVGFIVVGVGVPVITAWWHNRQDKKHT